LRLAVGLGLLTVVVGSSSAAIAQTSRVEALAAQLQQKPADLDVRLKYGLALAAAGRRDEADTELRKVLAAAPNYLDASLGLARIAFWRGDLDEAQRRLAPALLARPPSYEALELDNQIRAAQAALVRPWRADVTVSYSGLSHGLSPWRQVDAAVSRAVGAADGYVAGSIQAADRFGRSEVYAEGLYGRSIGGEATAYVAVGGAPAADFLPSFQIRAGLSAPIGGQGLTAGVDLARAEYASQKTVSVRATLRQPLFDDRLAVSGSFTNVWTSDGRRLAGYGVQGEARLARYVRLTLGYADAPESSLGIAVKTRATSAALQYQPPDSWGLRLIYTHEDRAAYERNELAAGTTLRF
jgi:YaiO family outer membrane protein